MTEVWASSKRVPSHLAATVDSSRAKHVAKALNAKGFKVRLVSIELAV